MIEQGDGTDLGSGEAAIPGERPEHFAGPQFVLPASGEAKGADFRRRQVAGGGRGTGRGFEFEGATQVGSEGGKDGVVGAGAEGDGGALGSGASGAAGPMKVGVELAGEVDLDDEGKVGDVEAPGGHIRGDEIWAASMLELDDDFGAEMLRHIAMESGGGDPVLAERFTGLDYGLNSIGEDQSGGRAELKQQMMKCVGLGTWLHGDDPVFDVRMGGGVTGADEFGVAEKRRGSVPEGIGEGRREEKGLSGGREGGEDGSDVLDEAHFEHTVGFIENGGPDVGEIEGVFPEKIFDPSRGSHHEMSAMFEGLPLAGDGFPADEQGYGEVGQVAAEAADFRGDLAGEFPGRTEDDALGDFPCEIELLKKSESEDEGFPAAGIRFPNDV